MYVQKEHVIKFFPNLLFRFGDDVIHQETIKCNITMNFKNKKQQYSIFSLKNRTVMSEHTKYRDNYEKKGLSIYMPESQLESEITICIYNKATVDSFSINHIYPH